MSIIQTSLGTAVGSVAAGGSLTINVGSAVPAGSLIYVAVGSGAGDATPHFSVADSQSNNYYLTYRSQSAFGAELAVLHCPNCKALTTSDTITVTSSENITGNCVQVNAVGVTGLPSDCDPVDRSLLANNYFLTATTSPTVQMPQSPDDTTNGVLMVNTLYAHSGASGDTFIQDSTNASYANIPVRINPSAGSTGLFEGGSVATTSQLTWAPTTTSRSIATGTIAFRAADADSGFNLGMFDYRGNSASGEVKSLTVPINVPSGVCIFVAVTGNIADASNPYTISDSASNTYHAAFYFNGTGGAGGNTVALFYSYNCIALTAGSSTISITNALSNNQISASAFYSAHVLSAGDPIDSATLATAQFTTATTTPTVTMAAAPATSNATVVGLMSVHGGTFGVSSAGVSKDTFGQDKTNAAWLNLPNRAINFTAGGVGWGAGASIRTASQLTWAPTLNAARTVVMGIVAFKTTPAVLPYRPPGMPRALRIR